MQSQWTHFLAWQGILQPQVCIMDQTPSDIFAEQILEKDFSIYGKAKEDLNLLKSFSLENLIETLKILEEKFAIEEDSENKRIYEKFILQTKGLILSYGDNKIAQLLSNSRSLSFLEVSYNFDEGFINLLTSEGKEKKIDFQEIDLMLINKICDGIDIGKIGIDSIQAGVKDAVKYLNLNS